MREVIIPGLLFSILLAPTSLVCSQTRPRRVGPPPEVFSESVPRGRAEERPRAVRGEAPRERAGRGSRWPRILLGAGIAIGAGRVGRSRSCTPSRWSIGGLPRFMSQGGPPR
jgi:hypothetical protein